MTIEDFMVQALSRLDTPISLLLLYLIIRDLLKIQTEAVRTLETILDRCMIAYGEEVQTRQLKDRLNKSNRKDGIYEWED